MSIRGRSFGNGAGRVTLTTTGTSAEVFDLAVSRWVDGEVVVRVPSTARSGKLELALAAGGGTADAFLPVVVRIDNGLVRRCFPYVCSSVSQDPTPRLFDMVGSGAADESTTVALYRECCQGGFTGELERVFGLRNENRAYEPVAVPQRSTAVAGTYSSELDTYLFVASNQAASMTSAYITTSTSAASAGRLDTGVFAGGADRVSVAILGGTTRGGPVPAMVAFSREGVVRTTTVADARVEPFNAFYAITSFNERYDRVTIARRAGGEMLMAYRVLDSATGDGTLTLRRNVGGTNPSNFRPVAAARPPTVGPNFEILALAESPGSVEVFVLVYEVIDSNGRHDVRIQRLSDFGTGPGYAPLPPSPEGRTLEDAGLIMREGVAWIAIVVQTQRLSRSAEMRYTEIAPAALVTGAAPPGAYPGVALDIARNDSIGRLGCKPYPQNTSPIGWLGSEANILFVRR